MSIASDTTHAPRRQPGAWHRRIDGLHVAKVTGSAYEMGKQHGALMKASVATGPLPYFRSYVEKLFGNSPLGAVSPLVYPTIKRLLTRRIAANLPDFARDAIDGLADGAELPRDEVLAGATMPDSLVWLAAKFIHFKRISPAVHHRLVLGLGCTSAMAWGAATVDGKLLHARNLDYHGVGCWPRSAAVVFHDPDDGQRYVSVTAAGAVMGGVTAMNEAGLSLAVHQHMFTHRASLQGMPIGIVGDIIMRKAESLDDAARILGQHRHMGCWTYLVTDGHRREVLCWEENPDRQVAHRYGPDDGIFGYANIYLDEPLGKTERNLYGSYWRHNMGRHQRANGLLKERFGQLDPDGMAGILGDSGSRNCRISDAIAVLMTVGSVVFRPEDGVLWVATGETPVSQHRYVPFDLGREDHAPEHGQLTGGQPESAAEREAFDCYRRAYLAHVDEGDLPGARELMRRACELQPEQPLYHCLRGLLALAAGDGAVALEAFGRALELGHHDPERLAAFRLWRGRSADLLGRRDEAKRDYQAALDTIADAPVHAAARRGLRRRYRARQAARTEVDFLFADVVRP